MNGKKFPHRGEIYWAKLDPTEGSEIKKKRPCLVISNDILNEMADVIIIAPITSNVKKVYSCEVKILLNKKPGKIMLQQSRAIDKSRLDGKFDELDFEIMSLVDEAIKVTFGIS